MIKRNLTTQIENACFKGKVIILTGPRQVGKTTLLKDLSKKMNVKSIWLNADEGDVYQMLVDASTSTALKNIIGTDTQLVFIDEAQQIPKIGHKLKLMIDTYPEIQIIVTGSSALDLSDQMQEALTGRKKEFNLYPISFSEMTATTTELEEKRLLHHRLIYGSYPEVINEYGNEREVLQDIASSYLYKDLLQIENIRKSSTLEKLLQMIAFQVGSEVSYNELARSIGNIDVATVEKYLNLLEKVFVVFKVPALSRNLRNELKKGKKYYFYDNGIRNFLINNFNPIDLRMDKGALWENYLMSERMKHTNYAKVYHNRFFWRTHDRAEIDLIEEREGTLYAYEFKWNQKKVRFPKSFLEGYPNHQLEIIDRENYVDFLK